MGYGTERAVIVAPPHVPHRENDTEHSWFITEAALRLHENREMLRMPFPKGFSLLEFLKYSHGHDLGELRAPDVDKVGGTLVIAAVGGGKWHDWEGESTTKEYMFSVYRPKIITPVGKKLWQATERYLDQRPYLFPETD
jgi:hypothetical protein